MESQMTETRDTRHETRSDGVGPARLDAWKLSDDLALEVFKLSRRLPSDLRWLSSQIARSATSVPANIAEGYSRSSKKEFLHFLSIARGSLTELEYYLHFLRRADLIDKQSHRQLADLRRRTGQTLFGLMKSVRSTISSQSSPSHLSIREPLEEYLTDGET
jgi:four helix bundle protein